MGKAKPTLGYPTRTDAVIALRKRGLDTHKIAEEIGIKPHTVLGLESSAKRAVSRQDCRTVVFPVELLIACGPHASRRGITPNELARRIVETAIEEKLIDALLDDQEAA